MDESYDVIVVGAGPAGIFTSLELGGSGLRVLLLDKGREISARVCPGQKSDKVQCLSCAPCHLVSGFGGAGAFSDGKLTVSTEVGGWLKDLVGAEEAAELVEHVDRVYLDFGAPGRAYGTGERVADLESKALLAGLRLIPVKLRHLGSEHCRRVLQSMYDRLSDCVTIRLGAVVEQVVVEQGAACGVVTGDGKRLGARFVVLAPGREGADWLGLEASRLKLSLACNAVDVGCRVEVPEVVMHELTSELYESKLEFYSRTFDDRVRTFCMCPGGEVIVESTGGSDPVVTVNGVSYSERATKNTNFAVLVSTSFTEPFREPIAYGKYLARLANILSGGVLVQRFGDLMDGRRSTPARIGHSIVEPTLKSATPGDLSFALPYRHLTGIVEMLKAMDRLAPGVASPHSLLYGIEVKFYSSQLRLSQHLETEVRNMFAAGDGAGISRGLVQASASGVVVAREILRRTVQARVS
jgi:hypothetical protein